MIIPRLFLIDLRENKSNPHVCVALSSRCQVQRLECHHQLSGSIRELVPDIICFEFDCPDLDCLKALELTKKEFPSIPILMITEYHDETLAIWALRARVWDYLVKPVNSEDLYQTVIKLTTLCKAKGEGNSGRNVMLPQQLIWDRVTTDRNSVMKCTTSNIIKYVENHYHEKIYIAELAKTCLISEYQFSRAFKRELGVTFRTYLVNYRLDKARELLNNSMLSVGDVSFAVGFLDHSYFTRMFKRRVGISPSEYRLGNTKLMSAL